MPYNVFFILWKFMGFYRAWPELLQLELYKPVWELEEGDGQEMATRFDFSWVFLDPSSRKV